MGMTKELVWACDICGFKESMNYIGFPDLQVFPPINFVDLRWGQTPEDFATAQREVWCTNCIIKAKGHLISEVVKNDQ